MPTTSTHTLYTFDELSERAKDKAREWFRDGNLDYEWWDGVYETVDTAAKILGIDLCQKPVKLMNGSTRYDPSIWFKGFYCQGSGSSFDGEYSYAKGAGKAIREEFPTTTELHSIADELQRAQRKAFYGLTARVKSNRDKSINVDVFDKNGDDVHVASSNPHSWRNEHPVAECMRDFNHWIFKTLKNEYEYLNSDESVDENIRANEYTFDVDGNRDD